MQAGTGEVDGKWTGGFFAGVPSTYHDACARKMTADIEGGVSGPPSLSLSLSLSVCVCVVCCVKVCSPSRQPRVAQIGDVNVSNDVWLVSISWSPLCASRNIRACIPVGGTATHNTEAEKDA